jgi:hypothetical protein
MSIEKGRGRGLLHYQLVYLSIENIHNNTYFVHLSQAPEAWIAPMFNTKYYIHSGGSRNFKIGVGALQRGVQPRNSKEMHVFGGFTKTKW